MTQRVISRYLLPAAVALLAAGCSSRSSVSLVKGKVLYNSQPLSGAELEFKPEKDLEIGAFTGQTEADGTFEIKIGKGTGMNARPGRFVVLITKGKALSLPTPNASMNEEERLKVLMATGPAGPARVGLLHGKNLPSVGILPQQYANASTTPFKIDISEGTNDLNPFRMEGPPLKK